MKLKKVLSAALIGATIMPMLPPSVVFAQSPSMNLEERKELAALTESQKLAVKALVMAAIVDSKVSDLVQVDEKMTNRYNSLRYSYLGSVPTAAMGGLATYTGTESLRKVEFVVKSLTSVLRAGWEAAKWTGKQISSVLDALNVDKAFNFSSKQSERTWDLIQPVLKLLITKNTAISSASVGTGAVFAGSVYFTFKDSKEAMSTTAVRNLLGQDDAIRSRVDGLVASIAPVVNMNAADQAKLKILIYDNVLEQAVKNKFSEDRSLYSLDIIDLMAKNNLADKNAVEGLASLRELAKAIKIEPGEAVSPKEIIVQNADIALGLAAVVEMQLQSGSIKDLKTQEALKGMLADIHVNMTLLGFNFKK
ncbi:MAG: hypothetical protein ABL958_03710 [Bdellovibrionia bacterium]